MNKNKELIKNTIIIFVGKFCTQFISFILVPIYTNYLITSDYGYIDLIQTYITLLVPILLLRFDSGIFRFLIDERENEKGKKKIISNVLIFLIIQIAIFIIIFSTIARFVSIKYCYAIIVNVIFMALSNILLQTARGIGDNIGYSIASIIAGITTIVFNMIFIVYMHLSGMYILYSSGIANILCSLFLIYRNKIFCYVKLKNFDKEKFKSMLKYSLPMIPDGLSWWVVNVSDRTIISILINTASNGIYAVSSKFSNILSSLFQIFNMSWQESASMHINDEDRESFFSGVMNTTYLIFFSICIMILVCIPFLFYFWIGEEYKIAFKFIPILLLGNLFNAIANITGGVYIAKKETKQVARTTMLAAILNIIINLIMIRKFGLYAAAISTLISYVVVAVYRYVDVKKYVNMKLKPKNFILTMLMFIFSSIVYYINKMSLNIINLCIIVILVLIINRETIKIVLNKVIGKLRHSF